MIEIRIYKKQEKILEVTCTGHANDAVNGSDLLCAMISAINTHTVNIFTDLLYTDLFTYTLRSGFFQIQINEKDYTHDVDMTLHSLILFYESLYRSFEKYMKIFYMEV